MLRSLYIKNFILVDELSVDFNSGFNVFTGETGAGKSIIINAISLLSNKRSSVSYIQNNKDKAIIEAIFDLNDNMKKVMDDNGIDHDEELILTRETSIPAIFAGGDVAPVGESNAINAMGAGKKAAKAINEYLANK